MANVAGETFVTSLIDNFTNKVAEKFLQEVSLIVDFKEDFEFFCDQLTYIKSLLTDAGGMRNSASVSKWLDSLRKFLSEADFMVQECEAEDRVERCAVHHMFAKMIFRCQMGRKIRNLKEKLNKIQQNTKYLTYLASVFEANARAQALDAYKFEDKRERSSAFLREAHTVGMEGDINVVIEWILQKDGPQVIAIVGMGGQGKTLLLQHIFNSQEVHEVFDCRVWLAISQKFVVIEVLRDAVNQFERNERKKPLVGNDENRAEQPNDEKLSGLSQEALRQKIRIYLEGKRCLFAVDDVWDRDAWEDIGLPYRIQDKVVLTTRDKAVAEAMNAQIHQKISLSSDMSWKLFCIHAFSDDAPDACPKELDEIAHSIVEKCAGNPLAIKTIGSYLARHVMRNRGLPNDWECILRHVHEAHGMRNRVLSSLRLSYAVLPADLQRCFLYCCVFPKNTQIDTESLVHGWIAEGFVPRDSYNVGLSYMEELIHRCLIEVSEVAGNGRAKSCKMHDLLHDLAVSEQTKCLLKPGGQLKSIPVEDCQGLCRISLMKNEISAIERGIECPLLQSLFLSHNYGLASISQSFFDNMKHLNVLDLSRTSITSLPDSIGNLKFLKYLNVSGTRIHELPESLSGLQQLQFLDVDETYVSDLHSGIDKHTYMLHLNLGRRFKYCPVGISKLVYLQTLNGVTFDLGESRSASALQLRDLEGLVRLQHLSIVFKSNSNDVRVEDEGTFRGMTEMRTLHVRCYGGTNPHLPTDMKAMQRLEIVHLYFCVVPQWIFHLRNLMELSLTGPGKSFSADFKGFEKIPNLKKLHLEGNTNRDFIEFPNEFGEAGAFPKLEELVIQGFEHLKSIPSFQEGAMPKLKCLRIMWCKPLENMPEGLTKLRNLKEVEVNMEVDDVEDYERKKMHYWQGLKDRQIKLKGEVWDGAKELRLV